MIHVQGCLSTRDSNMFLQVARRRVLSRRSAFAGQGVAATRVREQGSALAQGGCPIDSPIAGSQHAKVPPTLPSRSCQSPAFERPLDRTEARVAAPTMTRSVVRAVPPGRCLKAPPARHRRVALGADRTPSLPRASDYWSGRAELNPGTASLVRRPRSGRRLGDDTRSALA